MIYNDNARPYQMGFQDGATEKIYNIQSLYNTIIFYLIIISILITWIIIEIVNQNKSIGNTNIHLYKEATILEIIWTVTPALILIGIAIPSLKMLYLNEGNTNSEFITIKIIGQQWYWHYSYSEEIGYDSYMIPTDELERGQLRLLEVDNPVVIPILTKIKGLITSGDVIHSYAIPSLGIKTDAIPGRINEVNFTIIREGSYYGQCSELCGSAHALMPSMIKGVTMSEYINWLQTVA